VTSPFYILSEEDWKFFEENSFLGIMCWGGYILRKPGYQSILVDSSSPKIRHIDEREADELVSMLRGGEEEVPVG